MLQIHANMEQQQHQVVIINSNGEKSRDGNNANTAATSTLSDISPKRITATATTATGSTSGGSNSSNNSSCNRTPTASATSSPLHQSHVMPGMTQRQGNNVKSASQGSSPAG